MLARARIAPSLSAQRVAGLRNASHRRSCLAIALWSPLHPLQARIV